MGIFRRKEKRETVVDETTVEEPLLTALLGRETITRETALDIPSISACVNKIGDTIASLPIKLYRREGDRIEEVTDDTRLHLLNIDTGDTLDACQFKKAMVVDMLLGKGGYAYVNKVGGEVKSIHYVDESKVSFQTNTDPIFKDYKIQVHGKLYEGWRFIKLLRNTKNGYKGTPITEESALLLSIIHNSQKFEENLVKTGGNKKGFLESATRLTKESMTALKSAFRKMYSNNSENVIVLNDGVKFKEASNTSVELQLNENKKTNSAEVCKVLQMPPSIIEGGATEEDKKLFHENCIISILEKFNSAIKSVLLREDEKSSYFFAFDDTDLTKGDIEKRFRAYEIACKNGFMQVDEVRRKEKLPAFGLDFIKLGLQDVLYYPSTNEIYTPNTNQKTNMNAGEGGEIDAS